MNDIGGMRGEIVENLKPLGRVVGMAPSSYMLGFEIVLQLHKPCAVHDASGEDSCPDCVIIDRFLFAKAKDGQTFPVMFLNRPKAVTIGRGKYRKKAVETVWFAVQAGIEADWERFCELGARGFAYKGAGKKARRAKKKAR